MESVKMDKEGPTHQMSEGKSLTEEANAFIADLEERGGFRKYTRVAPLTIAKSLAYRLRRDFQISRVRETDQCGQKATDIPGYDLIEAHARLMNALLEQLDGEFGVAQ